MEMELLSPHVAHTSKFIVEQVSPTACGWTRQLEGGGDFIHASDRKLAPLATLLFIMNTMTTVKGFAENSVGLG